MARAGHIAKTLGTAVRGAFWGLFTLFSALTALGVMLSPQGEARLANMGSEARQVAAAVLDFGNPSKQADLPRGFAGGDAGILAAKLDAVQRSTSGLAAQQARTEQRLAAIEEDFGSLTGSLPRSAATAKGAMSPVDKNAGAGVIQVNQMPLDGPAPADISQEFSRLGTTLDASTSTGPVISRTDFAVEIGAAVDIASLEATWIRISGAHGAVLKGVQPHVRLARDGSGAARLALVAGPLRNARDAARICVALSVDDLPCRSVPFTGEMLALKGR